MTQHDSIRDLLTAARADRPKFEELIRAARALCTAFPANARTVPATHPGKTAKVQARLAAATKAGQIAVIGMPQTFKKGR